MRYAHSDSKRERERERYGRPSAVSHVLTYVPWGSWRFQAGGQTEAEAEESDRTRAVTIFENGN